MSWICVVLVAALLAFSPTEVRSQVTNLATWIDLDGDGLPDTPGTLDLNPSTPITIDIWADTQMPAVDPAWTNFNYHFLHSPSPDTLFFDTTTANITFDNMPGSPAPGTDFPLGKEGGPHSVSVGGFGYSFTGVVRLSTITMFPQNPGGPFPRPLCIVPIIQYYGPAYAISTVGVLSDYGTYDPAQTDSACNSVTFTLNSTEHTSWGRVKGLFN